MSDEDEDPFEELDDVGDDREGDPFEELDDVDPPEEGSNEYDAHDATPAGHRDELEDSPADQTDETPDEVLGGETGGGPSGDLDPLSDVDRVESDPFAEGSIFEEVDVGDLDPDQVWEQLTEAQARGSVSERQGRTYAEVSKHSYCEQCEFFSEPPHVSCSHEGTEIVEFVDMDTVRVVDCPIVAERAELEQE